MARLPWMRLPCRDRGIDVIIVDHHQVSMPEENALIYAILVLSLTGLAAVGVVFLLLVEMRRTLRACADLASGDRPLSRSGSLGAMADVAPLTG